MTHSEFESKSVLRHGHRYDYSKVTITNNHVKVEIVCPDHGSFMQAPDHHIRGRGCPTCARTNYRKVTPTTPEEYFRHASEVHKGFYNYSNSVFTSPSSKINIVCEIHGEFSTLARKHLQEKRGCPSCGRVKNRLSQRIMYQDFFDKAVDRHGYAYSYAETSLRFLSDDIDIVCPKHGAFTQVASDHIHGRGCPKCRPSGSSPENELADFIHGLGFDVVRNTRKLIPPLELDIVLPYEKLAFEFNGIFWHSEQAGKSVDYHLNKTFQSQKVGYRLFHVYESDWDLNKEVMQERIQRILSRKPCPDLSLSYPIEEYNGDHLLILKGVSIAGFRTKNGVAKDSWSLFGLSAIKHLMDLAGVQYLQSSHDWPEYFMQEFFELGFGKHMNVRPEKLYFDKKTLRRLKEKPREIQGLEFLSVSDSGSTIWVLEDRVREEVVHDITDGA